MVNGEDDCLSLIQNEEISERTPLTSAPNVTINNPHQARKLYKRQKQIYSAVTLADIFLKVVYTTILTSFLMFCYSYINMPYEDSLVAFYTFSLFSGLLLCVMNLNTDYCSSKQRTIAIGFLIYLLGLGSLSAISSYLFKVPRKYHYLCIVPLVLVSVGDSICKCCISDFTHTQLAGEKISEKLNAYLIKLFWIGHIGAFFILILLLGILEYTRFDLGYGLCSVCILAGLVAFCSAWTQYEEPPVNKSSVLKLIWTILSESYNRNKERQILQRDPFQETVSSRGDFAQHWLDFAKHSTGGSIPDSIVDQSKSFFRVSVLFLTFIPYWICNVQSYSTFIFQGFHLNRKVFGFEIPVAWVALFHIAAVLILAKLLDLVIYPCLRRRASTFPTGWRIITGMLFCILSMFCAASVEYVAHKTYINNEIDNSSSRHIIGMINVTYVEDIHVFWLIPQFTFMGISEVLVGLAGLGMGCKLCKGLLQKGVTSMYHFTVTTGHLISLVIVVSGWFPSGNMLENLDMAIYFLCLACGCFFSLLLFIFAINRLDFNQPPPLTTYQSVSRSQDTFL